MKLGNIGPMPFPPSWYDGPPDPPEFADDQDDGVDLYLDDDDHELGMLVDPTLSENDVQSLIELDDMDPF